MKLKTKFPRNVGTWKTFSLKLQVEHTSLGAILHHVCESWLL